MGRSYQGDSMRENNAASLIILRGRRAQMKQMETIMVLVIFFILLALSLIFYGALNKSSVRQQLQERFETDAVKIMQNALFLPELACTDHNLRKENCIDRYKAAALAELLKEDSNTDMKLFYAKEFGVETDLSFKVIFPDEEAEVMIAEAAPFDINEEIISQEQAQIPISIKDSERPYNEYSLGIMNIIVYKYGPRNS